MLPCMCVCVCVCVCHADGLYRACVCALLLCAPSSQLESDTRVLAWEIGRNYGIRINCISAGPLKSRAASAIAKGDKRTFIEVGIDYYLANAPLQKNLYSDDIGAVAAAMAAPAFGAVTGEVIYVDNGMHAMGWATEQAAGRLDGPAARQPGGPDDRHWLWLCPEG